HRPEAARTWPMVPPPREAVVAESFLERRLARAQAELGEQPAELRRADPPPVAIAPPPAQDVAQHPQRGAAGAQGHGHEMEHRALAGQAGGGPAPAERTPGLEAEAYGRVGRAHQHEREREQAQEDEDAVALDVEGLEARVRARAPRVVVVGHRAGGEGAAPARDPTAQAELGVVAVEEEALVEEADVGEHAAGGGP